MSFLNDLSSYLSEKQFETYEKLENQSSLKETLKFLLSSKREIFLKIAKIGLKIICESNLKNECIKKAQNKFLCCLLESSNQKVNALLSTTLVIVRAGFFERLLLPLPQKKDFYTFSNLESIIENFDINSIAKFTTESVQNQPGDQKIFNCSSLQSLFLLVQDFSPPHKKSFAIYDHFFHLCHGDYAEKLKESEKLMIGKALYRCHDLSAAMDSSKVDIEEFFYASIRLKEICGEEILETCLKFNHQSLLTLKRLVKGLNLLINQAKKDQFFTFFSRWEERNFVFEEIFELASEDEMIEMILKDNLSNRLNRFRKDSTVNFPLSESELLSLSIQFTHVCEFLHNYRGCGFNELITYAHAIREEANVRNIELIDRLKLVALGILVIKHEFDISLYSTQILTVLALLLSTQSQQAQVKTGEGKTIIITLWVFVMAMECHTIDIITSTRYLSIRDQQKYVHFFKRCGVSTSHICYDEKKPYHFEAQVLYAPAFDFEFAWMEDLLWGANLFCRRLQIPFVKRNFDLVCVDESDNLLIDAIHNSSRLAYPVEKTYSWLYASILSFVKNHSDISQKGAIPNLKEFLQTKVPKSYLNFLNSITSEQLSNWVQNAYQALFKFQENVHYVIKTKKNAKGEIKREVQIVDLETGRISENSRWGNSLHEFLEVKHDISIERANLTAISLSHGVFYKFYQKIIALTGTSEKTQTKEIYGISSFDVPPHLPSQRMDLTPILARSTVNYYQRIIEVTQSLIDFQRPVLILCETIQESYDLQKQLTFAKIEHQLLNEVQEEHEQIILTKAGMPSCVTVATNTAARGTDILLSFESIQNGGLAVLLVSCFASKRSENQGRGRAGRQGQPGSSQLILNLEDHKIQSLIGKINPTFSDEKILRHLENILEMKEQSLVKVQVSQVNLERYLAEKTHIFFHLFRNWVTYIEQDVVLEKYATLLNPIKLKKEIELDLSNFDIRDQTLGNECFRLLRAHKTEILSWKILLKAVIERMKEKMILVWINDFFNPNEKLLKENVIHLELIRLTFIDGIKVTQLSNNSFEQQFSQAISTELLIKIEREISRAKSQIDEKFVKHIQKLETYLKLDGSGVLHFLDELTALKLATLLSDEQPRF